MLDVSSLSQISVGLMLIPLGKSQTNYVQDFGANTVYTTQEELLCGARLGQQSSSLRGLDVFLIYY